MRTSGVLGVLMFMAIVNMIGWTINSSILFAVGGAAVAFAILSALVAHVFQAVTTNSRPLDASEQQYCFGIALIIALGVYDFLRNVTLWGP